MNKKKFIILAVILMIISFGVMYFYANKKDVHVYSESPGDLFAIMIEKEDGSYIESSNYEFPTDGYVFNEEKSYCVNGSTLVWTSEGLSVATSGSDNCYVYFDINILSAADIILNNNGGKEYIETKTEPDFTKVADTDEGMFATPDNYGTSYYFRGAVDNNWLYFNEIYWRIVRINGDGSIRLVYSGTNQPQEDDSVIMNDGIAIAKSAFNDTGDDNAYVGYMYSIGEKNGLDTSSTIKNVIDQWYTTNMIDVANYISDNLFCNDRGLASDTALSPYKYSSALGWNNGVMTGNGIGTSPTMYKTAERLAAFSNPYIVPPSLLCNEAADAFTVNDSIKGNAQLTNNIGLLSADEIIFAGGVFGVENSNYYLIGGLDETYWTISPFAYADTGSAGMYVISYNGAISEDSVVDSHSIKPALSLEASISITGSGLWNDPYIVIT